jgi:hypothetical protein
MLKRPRFIHFLLIQDLETFACGGAGKTRIEANEFKRGWIVIGGD